MIILVELIKEKFMDMRIFQVHSNKVLPHAGSILIASPLLYDYHFARSVILMVTHNIEGSMGIVMNKNFRYLVSLNQLVPQLAAVPFIPVFKGGPVERDTIFFLHVLKHLEGALNLGNGLYLNGDFTAIQRYILEGNPVEGYIRFFAGYAGWGHNQLRKEIDDDSWMVGETNKSHLLEENYRDLWFNSMSDLGNTYPRYPSCN